MSRSVIFRPEARTELTLAWAWCEEKRVTLLGIDLAPIAEVERRPHHHRDPFHRMLVAQARIETLALPSIEPAIDEYDIRRAP